MCSSRIRQWVRSLSSMRCHSRVRPLVPLPLAQSMCSMCRRGDLLRCSSSSSRLQTHMHSSGNWPQMHSSRQVLPVRQRFGSPSSRHRVPAHRRTPNHIRAGAALQMPWAIKLGNGCRLLCRGSKLLRSHWQPRSHRLGVSSSPWIVPTGRHPIWVCRTASSRMGMPPTRRQARQTHRELCRRMRAQALHGKSLCPAGAGGMAQTPLSSRSRARRSMACHCRERRSTRPLRQLHQAPCSRAGRAHGQRSRRECRRALTKVRQQALLHALSARIRLPDALAQRSLTEQKRTSEMLFLSECTFFAPVLFCAF